MSSPVLGCPEAREQGKRAGETRHGFFASLFATVLAALGWRPSPAVLAPAPPIPEGPGDP
jgi:hypothetical protein